MTGPPDNRVVRITRWLLAQDRVQSTSELAHQVGLSERVVRYRLGAVENYLRSQGARLTRQRGAGLAVSADDDVRRSILEDLDGQSQVPRVYAPREREHLLLDLLLWSYPAVTSLDALNVSLEVSKTSARRDLKRCEPWLERMGLPVVRRPGQGVELVGSEQRVRRAMVQLTLESTPPNVLDEVLVTDVAHAPLASVRLPAGLRERLGSLELGPCAKAVEASPLSPALSNGNNRLVFTICLALARRRARMGRPIELERGHLQSLIDHPAHEIVRSLTARLAGSADETLSDEETAGLTDYFLGLGALATVDTGSADQLALLESILDLAGARLHESLRDDAELRRSLAMHLNRLGVRLKYQLPVHNPLLGEVIERYPDVHAVSLEAAELISRALGSPVLADETGFITMYLSGAMERAHLRPRRQALVVCPSGMATAWVLVSRLQAEFPELALAEVASAEEYHGRNVEDFDIVISTVELATTEVPVAVVSPLLSVRDVAAVTELLGD